MRGALLVVEQNAGLSVLIPSAKNNPCPSFTRKVLLVNTALTHGSQLHEEELYVSSETQVLLYQYDSATQMIVRGPVVVVGGMPADGGTRSDLSIRHCC